MSLQPVAEGSHDDEQPGNKRADKIQWQQIHVMCNADCTHSDKWAYYPQERGLVVTVDSSVETKGKMFTGDRKDNRTLGNK